MSEKKVLDRFVEMQNTYLPKQFIKATEAQKREIYKDSHVETLGEELKIDTPGATRESQYIALYEAVRTESVLRGKISSCFVDKVTNMVNVSIVEENFKIVIPLPYLIKIPEKSIEEQKEEPNEKQLNYLKMLGQMRVGEIVDYIPRVIDEYEGTCLATRLMAMDRMKIKNYFPHANAPEPPVRVGGIVQGRVCYTNKSSMCVEIGGVEVVMRQVDISYLRISNVRTMYEAGDFVPVKIKAIDFIRDEKNNIVDIKVEANIKEAMKNPQKENFRNYEVNESVRGVVTQRTSEGLFIRIENTMCDVKCSPEKDVDEVHKSDVGDLVLVRITDKEEETYRLKGVIRYNYTKNSI